MHNFLGSVLCVDGSIIGVVRCRRNFSRLVVKILWRELRVASAMPTTILAHFETTSTWVDVRNQVGYCEGLQRITKRYNRKQHRLVAL